MTKESIINQYKFAVLCFQTAKNTEEEFSARNSMATLENIAMTEYGFNFCDKLHQLSDCLRNEDKKKGGYRMESMSQKELDQLHELQAKAKRVERQKKKFFEDADAHKEELLKRWNIDLNPQPVLSDNSLQILSDRVENIANLYGVSIDTLLNYISTDRQVSYFKNYGK